MVDRTRWTEPLIHSVGIIEIIVCKSCTAAEQFIFSRNCLVTRKIKFWKELFIHLS